MKKDNQLYTFLGLGLLAYFLMPSKANANTQKQVAPASGLLPSGGAPLANTPFVPNQTGKLSIPEKIPYPSQVEKDLDREKETEVNWNFGMISKTSKLWAGEYSSSRTGKNFVNRYAGLAALMYLLTVYLQAKKLNTIRQIGTLWEAKNKNLWIEKISQYTGFAPDEPLQVDSNYIFSLAYAISLYYQPKAVSYISTPVMFVALEFLGKYYKVNLQ